jgi:hypothetical protein
MPKNLPVSNVNGHSQFEERSADEIRRLWNSRRRSESVTNIYVHGPFCIQLCNFCMHKGVRTAAQKSAPTRCQTSFCVAGWGEHCTSLRHKRSYNRVSGEQ